MSHARTICLFLQIALTTLVMQQAFAQKSGDDADHSRQFGIGVTAGHYQLDPVVGVDVTSPLFLKRLCIRVRTNVQWFEHYKAAENDWATYHSLAGAVVIYSNMMERTRVYLEIGSMTTFPDKRFTARKNNQSTYGFAGIELFFENKKYYNLAFFFSAGSGFSHSYAEKLTAKPRYGNGFMFLTGFRIYI